MKASDGKLPNTFKTFAPVSVPVLSIALGSVASFPTKPLGETGLHALNIFLGKPINAFGID